mgnify:CR=1 FL=1
MTNVRLYLMTKRRLIQLQRRITFQRVPCVGEWLRFELSGLLPCQVTEVTHDEKGNVEVVIGAQKDDSGKVLFHETAEDLQEDVDELAADLGPNSTAAIIVFEHTWAIPIREAVIASGGQLLADIRVPPAAIEELRAELANEAL